ncbi:MAG: two-component sensor histidine kinase [Porticoccaceae bacterium]|nr:MAG: two-component sensor histidine kinase [Porticoccaceae bacterium]
MRRTRRPLSLHLRVMAFTAVAVTLALAALGQLVLAAVERHFAEMDAVELAAAVEAVRGALAEGPEALEAALARWPAVRLAVRDAEGRLVYASADPPRPGHPLPRVAAVGPDGLAAWADAATHWRGARLVVEVDGRPHEVLAALDIGIHHRFLDAFRPTLAALLSATAALALVASWLGVRRGLLPLTRLSAAMARVSGERFDVRLDPLALPPELAPLARTFNDMVARLGADFASLTRFGADLAHELRTPLAALITQTQVALARERDPTAYRELLFAQLEELERLARLVGDLLWLARCERGLVRPRRAPLALDREAAAVVELHQALAEERGLHLALVATPVVVAVDRDLVRRALVNLLDNALRHARAGTTVQVEVARLPAGVSLAVTNQGADIPPEHLSRLFDPFYRADEARDRDEGGAGLGLAIVQAVARAHGGRVEVFSGGGRTRFVLHLGGGEARAGPQPDAP